MSKLKVPRVEIDSLLRIIISSFKMTKGIDIDYGNISLLFIPPRDKRQLGLEINSKLSADKNAVIRVYISFDNTPYGVTIDSFLPELARESNGRYVDLTYVVFITISKFKLPIMSKIKDLPILIEGNEDNKIYTYDSTNCTFDSGTITMDRGLLIIKDTSCDSIKVKVDSTRITVDDV